MARLGSLGGLAVAILLAGACYLTAYRPVLGCQAELQMAEREPERAIEHLAAAAAADRFSPEPWQRLAAIELGDWIRAPGSDSFNRFESAMTHANRLAPNSASSWLAAGDAYSQAASALDGRRQSLRSEVLGKAVAADRRAVSLYPNSARLGPRWPRPCWRSATWQLSVARPELPCNWTGKPPTSTKNCPTTSATV